MLNLSLTKKIGDCFIPRQGKLGLSRLRPFVTAKMSLFVILVLCQIALAAGNVQFSAQVDRKQVSLGDTVTLNLTVKSDANIRLSEPKFSAPGLEVVHEFSSVSVSSTYDSSIGRFSTVNQHQITKVLQPTKTGSLKISGITLSAGGNTYKAPDISIEVMQGGAKPGPGNPLANQRPNPRQSVSGGQAFVKAEVNKQTAFKGEQIIVSYYLYHQMKVFNLQVDKFPVLSGFLREDLDLPVMGQRLETETVSQNGVLFDRALLARYAAYPLQDGKLSIDSMSLKYYYYNNPGGNSADEDDPFLGFFQQLTPKVASSQSERFNITVSPLPETGRPSSFTGGVGKFNVVGTADKTEVRANDAITLTVKVDGQGNVATIQEPKTKWPEDIEFYDSKSKSSTGRSGIGEKVFEFLLIPRVPGKLTLPALEFGFFDPDKKEYYTKAIEPIQITVLDPAPGSKLIAPVRENPKTAPDTNKSSKTTKELKYLKPPSDSAGADVWQPTWRILYWACSLAFFFLVGVIIFDLIKKNKRIFERNSKSTNSSKAWKNAHEVARSATQGASWQSVVDTYVLLSDLVLSTIESNYHIGAKSISRDSLKQILVDERGVDISIWDRIVALWEFVDTVRFASYAGGGVPETQGRNDLQKWTNEAEALFHILEREKSGSTLTQEKTVNV